MLAPDATPAEFIGHVLALAPRLAVFDCDGTLWAGDTGAEFFYWELERGLLPKQVADWAIARYGSYKHGEVGEREMCGEMVAIHAGLRESEVAAAAEQFFSVRSQSHIFAEMQELVRRLRESGCEIWAVSSTNEWVVRAGVRRFGIPAARVLAACVHAENGLLTARLREVPTGEGKAVSIRANLRREPDAVFGNSMHDLQMLELARHPFVINPTAEPAAIARERSWDFYLPTSCRGTARRLVSS